MISFMVVILLCLIGAINMFKCDVAKRVAQRREWEKCKCGGVHRWKQYSLKCSLWKQCLKCKKVEEWVEGFYYADWGPGTIRELNAAKRRR